MSNGRRSQRAQPSPHLLTVTVLVSPLRRVGFNNVRRELGLVRSAIECCQPTRSAITVAGIFGCSFSSNRICGSTASTSDPFGGRTYRGGVSVFSADATVFLAIPNSRAIADCESPSDLYSRRISAQFSNVITPQGVLGVLNFHPSITAQFSRRRHFQMPSS